MTLRERIDAYLKDPLRFPPEYMWWLRRLIEDEASGGGGAVGPIDSTENVGDEFGVHSTEAGGTDEAANRVLGADGAGGSSWIQVVGLGLVLPPFLTGYWYSAQFAYVGSSTTPLQAQMQASPFFVSASTSFDKIGVIMTAAWTTAEKTRLGIYADTGLGYPGALVVDAGQVDGSGSGAREKSITISATLAPGIYWLVGVNQGGGNNNTVLGHTTFVHTFTTRSTLTDLNPGSSGYVVLLTGITGALPNPFTAGQGFSGDASAIRVFLRVA